jgi:hypothetical protein
VYPSVNGGASGVGLMLELARLWHDQGLDARRSVLFVAWGAGGFEESGAQAFFENAANLRHLPALTPNRPAAIIELSHVGAGGEALYLAPGSNRELSELLSGVAAEVGMAIAPAEVEAPCLDGLLTRRVPSIHLGWADACVPPDRDRLEAVEEQKLSAVGEMLALGLTRMVRQARY